VIGAGGHEGLGGQVGGGGTIEIVSPDLEVRGGVEAEGALLFGLKLDLDGGGDVVLDEELDRTQRFALGIEIEPGGPLAGTGRGRNITPVAQGSQVVRSDHPGIGLDPIRPEELQGEGEGAGGDELSVSNQSGQVEALPGAVDPSLQVEIGREQARVRGSSDIPVTHVEGVAGELEKGKLVIRLSRLAPVGKEGDWLAGITAVDKRQGEVDPPLAVGSGAAEEIEVSCHQFNPNPFLGEAALERTDKKIKPLVVAIGGQPQIGKDQELGRSVLPATFSPSFPFCNKNIGGGLSSLDEGVEVKLYPFLPVLFKLEMDILGAEELRILDQAALHVPAVNRVVEAVVLEVGLDHGGVDAVGEDPGIGGVEHLEGDRLGAPDREDEGIVGEIERGLAVIDEN
tara:strand:+ start:6260 stop:7453 length:1194 start_codon:yes stop_codon:yes gene_type:complete